MGFRFEGVYKCCRCGCESRVLVVVESGITCDDRLITVVNPPMPPAWESDGLGGYLCTPCYIKWKFPKMTALERGIQLLKVPVKDLPPLAYEFGKKLCKEVGMCIETFLTAYTVYAQCVEGLECDDSLYKARPQDVTWFKERLSEQAKQVTVDLEHGEPDPSVHPVLQGPAHPASGPSQT